MSVLRNQTSQFPCLDTHNSHHTPNLWCNKSRERIIPFFSSVMPWYQLERYPYTSIRRGSNYSSVFLLEGLGQRSALWHTLNHAINHIAEMWRLNFYCYYQMSLIGHQKSISSLKAEISHKRNTIFLISQVIQLATKAQYIHSLNSEISVV